jgi:cytochrome P450
VYVDGAEHGGPVSARIGSPVAGADLIVLGMNTAYPTSPASWLTGHRAAWARDPLAFLDEQRRLHGGTFRFRLGPTPTFIVVSDAPSADAILRAKAASFSKPSLLSRFGENFFGRALSSLDGPEWRERRGPIQKALGGGTSPRLDPIDPASLDGDIVRRLAALFTSAFARWLLHLDDSDYAEHAASIARSLDALDEHMAAGVPWPSWMPLPRLRILRRERNLQHAMVGEWLRRAPADAPLVAALAPFDTETRLDNLNITVALGAHQTALAAAWTLLELSRRPALQERIAHEVDAPAGPTNTASCAVLESLRLHPPFYAIVRRALTDVVLPCGPIPRGATVMVSIHLLHRDPAVFADAGIFVPGRWIAAEKPGAFMPFGSGPRACIARHLLVPFVADVLSELLRSHEVLPPRVVPGVRLGTALRFDGPFEFGFRPRTSRAHPLVGHVAHAS